MATYKPWLITGASFCLIAVILGAFGAHGLKAVLPESSLQSFETGVRYQFYHGIALLLIATVGQTFGINVKKGLQLITLGTLLFSGSIYLLATKSILFFNPSFLGPITPVGGLLIIIGWVLLIINIAQGK